MMRELEKGLAVGVEASSWSLGDRYVEGASALVASVRSTMARKGLVRGRLGR